MDQLQAQRRLVKSPPELWAEVSDEDVLRHHLAAFGAIRITRVEPESTVAWEGDRASGTVSLDSAGWGTRVTLTAVPAALQDGGGERWVDPRSWVAPEDEPWSGRPAAVEEEPEPEPQPEEPAAVAEPDPAPIAPLPPARRGLFARLFGRRRPGAEITPPTPTPSPPDPSPPVPRPDPNPTPPIDPPTP